MSLKLYFHPLASFCHKVLIALYETGTPFEGHIVDLSDATSAANFKKLWPIGKFPVLRDEAAGRTIAESTIIIEYLAERAPGGRQLIPADPDVAQDVRLRDRFFDLYVHAPMQKLVGDRLRPAGKDDPQGVEEAKATLRTALGMIDEEMAGRQWATGDAFTMADCAAAPSLFFVQQVMPFRVTHKNVGAYLTRLMERPSYARTLREAKPYFHLFPGELDALGV